MHEVATDRQFPIRVVGVTAGLLPAAAVAGATVDLAMTLVTGGLYGPASVAQVLLAAAGTGAVTGAMLFPVGAWLFMRSVPLGRALRWTLISQGGGRGPRSQLPRPDRSGGDPWCGDGIHPRGRLVAMVYQKIILS